MKDAEALEDLEDLKFLNRIKKEFGLLQVLISEKYAQFETATKRRLISWENFCRKFAEFSVLCDSLNVKIASSKSFKDLSLLGEMINSTSKMERSVCLEDFAGNHLYVLLLPFMPKQYFDSPLNLIFSAEFQSVLDELNAKFEKSKATVESLLLNCRRFFPSLVDLRSKFISSGDLRDYIQFVRAISTLNDWTHFIEVRDIQIEVNARVNSEIEQLSQSMKVLKRDDLTRAIRELNEIVLLRELPQVVRDRLCEIVRKGEERASSARDTAGDLITLFVAVGIFLIFIIFFLRRGK